MKKLLGIVVLGLILSVNAIAATPFTYLSCKQIIKENKSASGAFSADEQPHLSVGSYNGHIFYKLKDVKKKTTVTVYEQGMMTETDWKDKKPGESNKDKFEYKDNIYSWGATLDTLQIGYAIENINGDYHQSMILKMGDDLNLAMDSKCNIVDKKTFKKLIKNGVN
tara:strand:+ start:140 stop:637 length:498 start_codon:yes stop_codon:yes gene_type:complete